MYVFRNHTVERLFPKTYRFSGYSDISIIPADEDGYVWFYQAPMVYDLELSCKEISDFTEKLKLVLSQVRSAPVFALTIDILYQVPYIEGDHRLYSAVAHYNSSLFELETVFPNLKVIDFSEFSRSSFPVPLVDWKYFFISQMAINPRLSREFQVWWNKKVDGILSIRKKCLILDLDNTLWGGVIGEDGLSGIKLGGDYPGNAYLMFQKAVLELSKSGIILAICSKNNEEDVFEVWDKHPDIILGKNSFSAIRINWTDKPTNIRSIAKELNIGLDSIVFVDDNPVERELVSLSIPEVIVPDFPEHPYMLPDFIKGLVNQYFSTYSVTSEDRDKALQYNENASRIKYQENFDNYHDYLKNLDIKLRIYPAEEVNIPRIAQMSQKTNQFNLTTKRYSESDIREMLIQGYKFFCLSVSDKFGDSGLTGCMIIRGNSIDSLFISCRVLGRGIENAFVNYVLQNLSGNNRIITASYIPTVKNSQTSDFYEKCGFTCVSESDGVKLYEVELPRLDINISDIYEIN